MLTVVLYIVAIVLRVLVGEAIEATEAGDLRDQYEAHWGRVERAMATLLRMTTYDNWTGFYREAFTLNFLCGPLLFAFLCVSSLNITNIVVGIMVHSAIQVAAKDHQLES